jgi:hypothetical protein
MCPTFNPLSGGIRVMYGLYGWLLAKGQIAFLNAKIDVPFIGIYPEIYEGNWAGADYIVRFLLNKPGVMGSVDKEGHINTGPLHFFETDTIIEFTKLYDTFNTPDNHLLFLPILNLHLFKDQKKNRTKIAYYVGKGENLELHPKEAIGIFNQFAIDQGALADLLNECQTLYTYENPTAMNEIARLCGCQVVFIPNKKTPYYTKEQLETLYEPGMEGISWFGEEKKGDLSAFRSHYVDLGRLFSDRLDQFIVETQSL